jgi:D-galactonate transporter
MSSSMAASRAVSAPKSAVSAVEASTMRAVSWRLMPFLLAAYVICYIDRVNIGFAALQMNKAVGIDPKTYGLGAGIFFIGYFILEVPSNLCLERFGASKWIARIMITWGLASGAFALIGGPISFLVLRFLLGAAEAGFFPGVILYLTYWYPAVYRAKIVGIFMVAIPVAGMIGSPISGAILGMDGFLGLGGWQWIFILEAIPAICLGFYAFFRLTDRPTHATWLSGEQKTWLTRTLEFERTRKNKVVHESIWKVLTNKHVLIMALVYAGAAGASTGLALWMPQLVKPFGLTNFQTGLVNAIPFAIAAVWMILWGRSSDRSGERVWHNAIPLMWMVVAMVLCFYAKSLWTIIPLLTLIAAGTYASKGPFWALSSEWLGAAAAAAGLAQINALGNLSAFFFNYMIGYIKDETGSYAAGLMPIALTATIGVVCVLLLGRGQPRTVALSAGE